MNNLCPRPLARRDAICLTTVVILNYNFVPRAFFSHRTAVINGAVEKQKHLGTRSRQNYNFLKFLTWDFRAELCKDWCKNIILYLQTLMIIYQ